MLCERCNENIYNSVRCDYCKRRICNNCMKSSKKISKTAHLVICKDCWSKAGRKKAYKRSRASA